MNGQSHLVHTCHHTHGDGASVSDMRPHIHLDLNKKVLTCSEFKVEFLAKFTYHTFPHSWPIVLYNRHNTTHDRYNLAVYQSRISMQRPDLVAQSVFHVPGHP